MKLWLIFLSVFLVGLIVFFPTFNLSLYGDDWLVFWRFDSFFPPLKNINLFDFLKHFLTRYGSQDILMGFLRSIFSYHSEYYYITSFVMRMLAAFSLFPIALYFTKDKLASFFAILFFSVTTIGLETTEYVSHITSYIGLSFFNLFLYYFLKSREIGQSKKSFFFGLFFFLTFITVPIRMTGLLPFILLIELFWAIQNWSKTILKKTTLRLSFIFFIFIFINLVGNPFFFPSQGGVTKPPSNIFLINQTTDSLSNMLSLLENQRSDFLFYPIISLGSMFLPDTVIKNLQTPFSASQKVVLMTLVYSLFAVLVLIIKNSILIKKARFLKPVFIPLGIWSFVAFEIYSANQITIPNPKFFILLLVGGYMAIFSFYLLCKFYNNYLVSQAIFISLCWSIVSFFIPWFWSPTFLLETYHRYLIGSAVGISIFLAILISLAKDVKHRRTIFSLFVVLLLIHIWTTRERINILLSNHNQQFNDKIWTSMPYIKEVGDSTEPLIFYFKGDGTNESILHDTVTFGFPFHMGILYNTSDENRNPISMIEWSDIESAVLDGKSFAPHRQGKILNPISTNRVYAFQLHGKDNLVNITDETRAKLTELLQNRQ